MTDSTSSFPELENLSDAELLALCEGGERFRSDENYRRALAAGLEIERRAATRDSGPIPVMQRISEFEPLPVDWLWPGRIPLGMVTILDGDPGLGKSLVTIDLAARVTTGELMPDGYYGALREPRDVLLVACEDDPARTARPRFEAAGGDVDRLRLLTGVRPRPDCAVRSPMLDDIGALRKALEWSKAALVVIDPLMAYLPGDANSDQEVRQILKPLVGIAAEHQAAVLVVRHLNKKDGGNPLYRGGGSIGIIGTARSGLLVAPDPDDKSGRRRVLASTKGNLAAPPSAMTYEVEAVELKLGGRTFSVPRVVWGGLSSHTIGKLLAEPQDEHHKTALGRAKAWALKLYADGPVLVQDVRRFAIRDGISLRTLQRAEQELGVDYKCEGGGSSTQWWRFLPGKSIQ